MREFLAYLGLLGGIVVLLITLAALYFATPYLPFLSLFLIGVFVLVVLMLTVWLGIHIVNHSTRVLHATDEALYVQHLGRVRVHQHRLAQVQVVEQEQREQPLLPSPRREQVPLRDILDDLRPNALEFSFGVDEDGNTVKTTLPQAVHIQLLGASGQGKSRQATSILTQLCTRNDTEHLQLALIDAEGETTEPFKELPHVRYIADESREAARVLRSLVKELERRDETKATLPVLLIFVEEFLNLRRTMQPEYRDQALEDYTTLALRGRKRGMFLFSIGQTAYTEKAIRDAQTQFLSSMAFAIKPTAARAAGFMNTPLLNQLYSEKRPGQFLLERPQGDALLYAHYVDPAMVQQELLAASLSTSLPTSTSLLNPFTETIVEAGDMEPLQTRLDARSLRVRELLRSGTPNRKIVEEIWGATGGASYQKAAQELSSIIARLV